MRSSGKRIWLLGLGLAAGAVGGLVIERRARARRMPHLDAWQGALAPAILWQRTKTLSRGDDRCDCCWRIVNGTTD